MALIKEGNYGAERAKEEDDDGDLLALVSRNLERYPLAGFVLEGHSPYGTIASGSRTRILKSAVYCGMPVVIVGRGNNEGFTGPHGIFVGGRNLTATKARLLLMACLMRFGAPPPAADPDRPTDAEAKATRALLDEYQRVFDTH